MRKLMLFILVCIPTIMLSCTLEGDYNLPEEVTFTKEGGVMEIESEKPIDYLSMHNDEELNTTLETIIVRYQWLSAQMALTDSPVNTFTLSAEPNTSGEDRTIKLLVSFGEEYWQISVKQEGQEVVDGEEK